MYIKYHEICQSCVGFHNNLFSFKSGLFVCPWVKHTFRRSSKLFKTEKTLANRKRACMYAQKRVENGITDEHLCLWVRIERWRRQKVWVRVSEGRNTFHGAPNLAFRYVNDNCLNGEMNNSYAVRCDPTNGQAIRTNIQANAQRRQSVFLAYFTFIWQNVCMCMCI